MAITDANLQFSSNQTLTGTSSPILGAYSVDAGTARDIGQGEALKFVFRVNQSFAGTLTSLACQIVQADDAGLTTNVDVLGSTGAIDLASLTAGAIFVAKPGPLLQGRTARRYIGVRYVPSGGLATAGAMSAAIEADTSDGMKPSLYGSSGGGFKVL